MRAWLYDWIVSDPALASKLGVDLDDLPSHVTPRRAQENVTYEDLPRPFLIYGLGNATAEQLSDSTANDAQAERQFFQVWVHDEGGDFNLIDEIVAIVIKRLRGAKSVPDFVYTVEYLETSQEFNNQTYGTNFRYIRFQAIKAKVGAPA
jgi:hypothetical protein